MSRFRLGVVSALSLLAAGCGDERSSASGGEGGNATPTEVTFHKDVEPILQKSCLGCHYEGQIGGFSLLDYDEAAPMAGFIAAVTEARLMPPWGAQTTDECQPRLPYKDDLSLSDEEIATLRAWADAGAPQGDPADAPPPYQLKAEALDDIDAELAPTEPSIVQGDSDDFVCVIYDPQLTEEKWIDGIHFVPGNLTVAHHALTFRADRADMLELSGGSERFPCFGGTPGSVIHAWAPGGNPYDLPEKVGIKLKPEEVLVVQMHYHPTGTSVEEDVSTLQLSYADTTPDWQFVVTFPGNASDAGDGLLPGPNDRNGVPEFYIPANATDHTEEMEIRVPDEIFVDLPILMVMSHMHYVGVDLKLEIERANLPASQPQNECFLQTPAWDFNWQRFYQFDVPIEQLPTAKAGDILRISCRYDNSMQNPFLREALETEGMSAPVDVFLGEETLDEMCLAPLGVLVPSGIDI
jgi:hypothetical protein